jgi:cytochrome P450
VKEIDMSKAAEQIPEQIEVFDESQQVKFYANQPEYSGYRKPLYPCFSRSFFLRYENDIRELARAVIKKFLDRGELEFVEDFAIPFSADALTRASLAIEVDERPFTAEERLGITTLFLDGPDTTRGMLVNIAYHLATRDDVEAHMKQPGLLSELLDEFTRLELPVSNLHADFGLGIHRRLGAAFARIQIAIAFEELLAAASNFRLTPDADIPRYTGSLLTSPSVLRLEFDRSAPSTAEEGSLPSGDTTVRSVQKIFAVRSDIASCGSSARQKLAGSRLHPVDNPSTILEWAARLVHGGRQTPGSPSPGACPQWYHRRSKRAAPNSVCQSPFSLPQGAAQPW